MRQNDFSGSAIVSTRPFKANVGVVHLCLGATCAQTDTFKENGGLQKV